MRGHDHVGDAGHRPGLVHSPHFPQHASAVDRQHQDSRGGALARQRGSAAQGVEEEELLQGDAHAEAERPAAQAADRSRGHLQGPRPVRRQPKLRVDGAVGQSQSARCARRRLRHGTLQLLRMARRGHVEGLFEVRAVEWVGLVEQRQHPQRAAREQAFQRHFRTRQELLDQHPGKLRVAPHRDLGRTEEPPDAVESRAKLLWTVRADDAAAPGEDQRLHYAGERHTGRDRGSQLQHLEAGHRDARTAQALAGEALVARRLDRLGSVVQQAEQAGRPRGDHGRLVVRAQHGPRLARADGVGQRTSGALGIGEVQRERPLRPLLGQDVAAVGGGEHLHAQLAGRGEQIVGAVAALREEHGDARWHPPSITGPPRLRQGSD